MTHDPRLCQPERASIEEVQADLDPIETRHFRAIVQAMERRWKDTPAFDPSMLPALWASAHDSAIRDAAQERAKATRFASLSTGAFDFTERHFDAPRSILGDGILCAGDLAVFYGRPGIGKTWLTLQLALDMVRGQPWCGIPVPETSRVGILELELHAYRLQQRLHRLAGDRGLSRKDNDLQIVARPDLQGLVNVMEDSDWTSLREWCQASRLNVLMIDALSRIHEEDESSAQDFAHVLGRLDQLRFETGTAVILVHHERKSQNGSRDDDMDALRGTSRLASDPNALIRVSKVGQGDLMALRFPKVNNAQTPKPIYLLQDSTGQLLVTDSPESVGSRNRDAVMEALEEAGDRGITTEKLSEATRLGRAGVGKHLRAIGAVQVANSRPPRYRLPATAATGATPDPVAACKSPNLQLLE